MPIDEDTEPAEYAAQRDYEADRADPDERRVVDV
jgi:hypothetical protein